jgi:acyl transferase domain-containing protein
VFTASQPNDFVVPISGFSVARAVASALRVTGPHRNTDAACSSGYLSTHHALDAVQAGECSAAVVAGVSLLLKPDSALGLYMTGVLSPSGNMRPFDTAADGMVWGEACSALVL